MIISTNDLFPRHSFPYSLPSYLLPRNLFWLDFVIAWKVLDDILPEFKRHDRLDDEEALQKVLYKTIKGTVQQRMCSKAGGTIL